MAIWPARKRFRAWGALDAFAASAATFSEAETETLSAAGAGVAERVSHLTLNEDYALTVTVARSCGAATCEEQCTTNADCTAARPACAEARCTDRVCLLEAALTAFRDSRVLAATQARWTPVAASALRARPTKRRWSAATAER